MKSPEAASLRSEIGENLSGASTGNEAELVKRADFLIEAEVRAMAAEERRRAVLEGLASLGYEVSEGMATAWVKDGRVVLRKAANPGYGVELSGGSTVGSFTGESCCVRKSDRNARCKPGSRHGNDLVRRIRTASILDRQGRRKPSN